MIAFGHVDCFEIVNGPEDGTTFPITRSPADIGTDPSCAVHPRLDEKVKKFHARVSVVSEGYRIRGVSGAPVTVNGKHSGLLRSRILRSGGFVNIGETTLHLHCVADGLASRSHGLPTESDFVWTLRQLTLKIHQLLYGGWRTLSLLLRVAWRTLWSIPRLLKRKLIPIALVTLVALWYFRPDIFAWLKDWFWYILNYVRSELSE